MKYLNKKNILLSLAYVVIVSCNYSGKLTKRYNKIEIKPDAAEVAKYVQVSAYIPEKEKAEAAKPKTIFDLTEKAQKELIKQLGINDSTDEKLITSLTASLSAKPTSSVELLDYTRAEKRVVVSITNLSHWPADRISKITVKLKIADDFQLLSCNRLTTEYQTLDLGKLNYSNTTGVELNANVGYGATLANGSTSLNEQNAANTIKEGSTTGDKSSTTGSNASSVTAGIGASGKFNASRSFAEEVLLRQRIVSLNASISENTLTLSEEGISGIDLSGNIIADIIFDSKKDIKVDRTYSIGELSTNGAFNDADKLKVKEVLVEYFNFDKDIKAELSFTADYRHVIKRDNTITESDDIVELYHGEVKAANPIVLLTKDQLRPKLWVLYDRTDQFKKPVTIYSPNTNGNGELIFNSYSDAKNFLSWLLLKSANVVTTNAGKIGTAGHIINNSAGLAIDIATIQKLQVGVSQ